MQLRILLSWDIMPSHWVNSSWCFVKTQWSHFERSYTWKWDHYTVSKQWEWITQWYSIISQNTALSVFPKFYCSRAPLFLPRRNNPQWAKASSLSRIHDHTQLNTSHSVGLLWTSDQPDTRNLYPITHNTRKRQTSMSQARFEPIIPASEWPQTLYLRLLVHCDLPLIFH